MTADDDTDNVSIKLSPNGAGIIEFVSLPNNNKSTAIEYESSGDGDAGDEYDFHEIDPENKFGFIPIPNNYDSSSVINAQLQRLSQLVQSVDNEKQTIRLKPEQLNQLLTAHNIKLDRLPLNKYSDPIPDHGMIDSHHLDQIIDLQSKLNKLVALKNELSTPSPPIQYAISGNGVYPSDATTLHIKATNNLKNPNIPEPGYTSSQIVVNRPGGSVVFRLPEAKPVQDDNKNDHGHISEETLKRLLELSQKMSNQAPNTPNFVHDPPPPHSQSGYYPIVQPILLNNFPWDELKTLIAALQPKKVDDKPHRDSELPKPMNRVSSVSGSVSSDNPMATSAQDDVGPTTIVHTHIPITIANPGSTNTLMTRLHGPSATTVRPKFEDKVDSYGNRIYTVHDHNALYPPYQPQFAENAYNNGFNQQTPSIYNQQQGVDINIHPNVDQPPQYIKISQSQPDPYTPQPINTNGIMGQFARPIATFASINGGHTQRIDSTYGKTSSANYQNSPNNMQSDSNDASTNYVPIYSSNSKPTYSQPSTMYTQNVQKLSVISDKMDEYVEPDDDNTYAHKSGENDEYMQTNVEQMDEDIDDDDNGNDNDNDDGSVDNADDGDVMSILANYHAQTKQALMNTITPVVDDRPPQPPPRPLRNPTNKNQKNYVIFNGNIITQEIYEDTIEPYLQGSSSAQVEYLTCATGIRQANTTDCTRYFVCDSKTGKILSYTCPPFTAFNADTKMCNADMYSRCYPTSVGLKKAANRLKEQQALIEANRIKTEALKAQQLAQLVKLETKKLLAAQQAHMNNRNPNTGKATRTPMVPTKPTTHSVKRLVQKTKAKKPTKSSANRPTSNRNQPTNKVMGKRKIPCRTEGKLADRLSKLHYFLCFKDANGTMRARRLQCPANLTFCEGSHVCTQNGRCTGRPI